MLAIENQLARDFLRKGRWLLLELGLLAPLNILGLFLMFSSIGQVEAHGLRFIFRMTLLVEALGGTALIGFGQSAIDQVKLTGGFPPRLYTLPVSTARLVLGQMAPAIVLLAVLHLADALFFRLLTGVWPPLLEPVLFITATYAWAMAVVWGLPRAGGLRIPLLAGMALPLGLWFAEKYSTHQAEAAGALWAPAGLRDTIGLALAVAAGCGTAIAGVRRDRRGDPPGLPPGLPSLAAFLNRLWDLLPQRERPFASPRAAQLWFECRQKGWIIPAGTLQIMVLGGWAGTAGQHRDGTLLSILIGMPFYLVPALGLIAGFIMGRSEFNNTSDLDLFRATRPLGDHAIAAAMHKTGALSILMATAIHLSAAALVTAAMALCGKGKLAGETWGGWIREFGVPRLGIWSYPALLLLAMLAAWVALSLATVLGQAGHGRFFAVLTAALMALVIGFILAQFWIPREVTLRLVHGALAALGGCGLLGGAWTLLSARRRGLIGRAEAGLSGLLWFAVICAAAWGWHIAKVNGHGSIGCFAVGVLALAPVTPALGALAIAWNRHR